MILLLQKKNMDFKNNFNVLLSSKNKEIRILKIFLMFYCKMKIFDLLVESMHFSVINYKLSYCLLEKKKL